MGIDKNWCLTCDCIAKPDCSTGHETFPFDSATLNNVESLIDLTQYAIKAKEKRELKLNFAIRRTERVQLHLSIISEGLKRFALEVEELNEENDMRLAVAASMLESVDNLLDPDEPMDQSLVERVNQFVDQCQEELKSAVVSAPLIHQPKTRIQVDSSRGMGPTAIKHRIVDARFTSSNIDLSSSETLRNLLVLRHISFSILRHDQTIDKVRVCPINAAASLPTISYDREYLIEIGKMKSQQRTFFLRQLVYDLYIRFQSSSKLL